MAKQSAEQKHSIEIAEETHGLPVYFANQFRAAITRDTVEVYLTANLSGQNVTNLLLVVPPLALLANKETVTRYYDDAINTLSTPGLPLESVAFTSATPTVYYGNLLDFSRFSNLAQMRLSFFSIRKLAGIEPGTKIKGWPVCAINMTIEVQLGIIKRLYFSD